MNKGHDLTVTKKQLKGQTPDEEDRKNIIAFIKLYDETFPYPHEESLQRAIQEGMDETVRNSGAANTGKKGEAPKRVIRLPAPFVMALKKSYPLIFSDKAQFEWFIKNFPNLTLLG